ncbi:UpxY family transcription antiterminator [Arenibacter algicola]|uniref:UpxY family transcription antiterminator n=1 Tax=Arenibacter algicola TaxID=616991 RepID=UPI0004DEDE21|nr:UpxY family transcription antiterminator [Arenibacter algicola]
MNWYALYTKPRQEKKVASQLEKQGINVYCPMTTEMRQWSDRKKKVEAPLLPNYVFVEVEEKERSKVYVAPGVVRYVFWLGKPAKISLEEINILKESISGKSPEQVRVEGLKKGDNTIVKNGPFKGQSGVVKQVERNRVQLLLKDLGFIVTITA